MAIIDEATQQLVLRITFAGTPLSGKTTTLRALAEQWGAEVETPEETKDGRTLYFDWLEHVAGNYGGRPIRCQVVTVPGQAELRDRRNLIVDQSDTVVFVIDSSPDRFDESWLALLELRERLAERTDAAPAIVLQANKRDLPDAVPMDRIRARASEFADVAVHETVATKANGIRVSFVFAVRLALDRVRALQAAGVLAHREIDDEGSRHLRLELDELARRERAGDDVASPSGTRVVGPEASLLTEGVWPPIRGRVLLQDYAAEPVRELTGDDMPKGRNEGWEVRATAPRATKAEVQQLQLHWIRKLNALGDRVSAARALVIVREAADRWRLWQLSRLSPSLADAEPTRMEAARAAWSKPGTELPFSPSSLSADAPHRWIGCLPWNLVDTPS